MSGSPEWPAERTTLAIEMWDAGFTASQIALRLGVSRNALIGKVHRLGLPARPSPIRPAGSGKTPGRRRSLRLRGGPTLPPLECLPRKAPPARPTPAEKPRPVREPEPKPEPVQQRWSPFTTCQFPLSSGRPWRFCGEAVDPKYGTYCTTHGHVTRGTPTRSMERFVAA